MTGKSGIFIMRRTSKCRR